MLTGYRRRNVWGKEPKYFMPRFIFSELKQKRVFLLSINNLPLHPDPHRQIQAQSHLVRGLQHVPSQVPVMAAPKVCIR